MIQLLRKKTIGSAKNFFEHSGLRSLRSRSGQIGIILILLAAFGLLFYAVALNFSRASDLKTRTLIAAESSSALTASYLAGTAEKLSQEQLKGEAGYCDSVSWLEAVFKIILLIIVIIIAVVINIIPGVGQMISALLWAIVVGSILAIVMTTISIVLQITVVQPGITSMWNEMMMKSFENVEDQVLEQGIQVALQKLVDDPVEIPDVLDFDNDGVYVVMENGTLQGEILDQYSRFAHYNTLRLQGVVRTPRDYVEEFVNRLEGLLNVAKDTDTSTAAGTRYWGLYDEQRSEACPNNAAVCNPYCLPPDECCSSCQGDESCGDNVNSEDVPPCCKFSPCPNNPACAGATNIEESYSECYEGSFLPGLPFIYDPFYENATNNANANGLSFREWLGHDDVTDAFRTTLDTDGSVNWRQKLENGATTVKEAFENSYSDSEGRRFRPQDAAGFYAGEGIFPLFYKSRDQVNLPSAAPNQDHLGCMWWNKNALTCGPGTLAGGAKEQYVNPHDDTTKVQYDGKIITNDSSQPLFYWDYIGGNAFVDMGHYEAPDRVTTAGLERLFAEDAVCADDVSRSSVSLAAGDSEGDSIGFLGIKPGADFYCSESYPYDAGCRKHGTCTKTLTFERVDDETGEMSEYSQSFDVDCGCGESNDGSEDKWPDDFLDAFYRKITELVLIKNELKSLQAKGLLMSTFSDWYDKVADWIEPAYKDGESLETFTRNKRWGYLWVFREQFREIHEILNDWVNERNEAGDSFNYQGTDCSETWCLPNAACGMLSKDEKTGYGINPVTNTYNAEANSFEGVLQCMEWAGSAVVTRKDSEDAPLVDSEGEQYKGVKGYYQACLDHCGTAYCDDLPRPFVPDFKVVASETDTDDDWRMKPDMGDYETCLSSLTVEQCMANCSDVPGYTAPGEDYVDCEGSQQIDSCLRDRLHSCGWVAGGDPAFYDGLVQGTSCSAETPYRQWLMANIAVADDFVAKLEKRHGFLTSFRGEMIEARDNFREVFNRLTEFLDNGTSFGTKITDNDGNSQADLGSGFIDPDKTYIRADSLFEEKAPRFPYDGELEHQGIVFNGTGQDSPSEALIAARRLHDTETTSSSGRLPAFVIYVWREEPSENPLWSDSDGIGGERTNGLLHAVKVEARVPRRCNGRCDYLGTGPVDWPKIETYTTGFLDSTRCYELKNHFGMTKARAIRFDQAPNISRFKLFNKIPFLKPSFAHPDAVRKGQNITGGDVFRSCAMHVDELITELAKATDNSSLKQAFMINWQPESLYDPEDEELPCWKQVHENILRYGVQSTSCANYYWGGSGGAAYGNNGMRVKFTPCNEGFIKSGDL